MEHKEDICKKKNQVRMIDANELLGIEKSLETDIVRRSKTASWLFDQMIHDIESMPTIYMDREAWEPCEACKDNEITIHVPEFKAMAVCNQHMDHGAFDLTLHLKFCPWCGRPLTPEAWAELEKRLRG